VGYMCWKSLGSCIPLRLRLLMGLQCCEVVFWLAGILIGWGSALASVVRSIALTTNHWTCGRGGVTEALFCYNHLAESDTTDDRFVASVDAVAFAAWLFVTVCQVSSAEWLSAHHLVRGPKQWANALVKWTMLPFAALLLFVAPSLDAHTTLLRKIRLTYSVAPKSTTPSHASSYAGTPNGSYTDVSALGQNASGLRENGQKTNPTPNSSFGDLCAILGTNTNTTGARPANSVLADALVEREGRCSLPRRPPTPGTTAPTSATELV